MPITKRTLTKWRREALVVKSATDIRNEPLIQTQTKYLVEMSERILRLTQELLDQHLLTKG